MSTNFNPYPAITPIPTPQPWSVPQSLSGTLTSGSAVITMASTAGLSVGQRLTGTGIPNNAWIVSIVANTSITINLNATANGAQTLSFLAYDPYQSQFAQPSPFSQMPPITGDVADCAFLIPDQQSVAATTGVYVPAPGLGLVTCSGAGLLQFNINGTWTTVHTFSATTAIRIRTDGGNVRFANTTGGALTFTYYQERSSSGF